MTERHFFKAAWSLITGLAVTFKFMFRRRVTIQYPHETVPVTPAFRGSVYLIKDDAGNHKCVGCLACQKICPTKAIPVLDIVKNETNKTVPQTFVFDDALCCYCGLCVEVCPTEALAHADVADSATGNKYSLLRTIVRDRQLTDHNNVTRADLTARRPQSSHK